MVVINTSNKATKEDNIYKNLSDHFLNAQTRCSNEVARWDGITLPLETNASGDVNSLTGTKQYYVKQLKNCLSTSPGRNGASAA